MLPSDRRPDVVAALRAAHPYEEPAFDVYDVVSNTGFIGRIGSWSGTLEDLGRLVAERLGGAGLRVSGAGDRQVSRVAVVPGSGADFLSAARSLGADAIVTGDVSHHRIVAANDRGLSVIDPGVKAGSSISMAIGDFICMSLFISSKTPMRLRSSMACCTSGGGVMELI